MLAEVAGLVVLIIVTLAAAGLLLGVGRILPRLLAPRPRPTRKPTRADELAAARERRLARLAEIERPEPKTLGPSPEAMRKQTIRFKRATLVFLGLIAGVILLVPWTAELRLQGQGGLVAAGALVIPLLVALLHVRAKGGLEW